MNRIFVIDDEAAMGENIQRMLKFPETTVTAYADPVKGLADALAKPPDLVLLDMRMPGMSGEEVFARLHEAHPGLPIVFLTAFGSVEGAVLAMRNGAFDYLQKPFKREDLLLVVKRALSHAELEQEVETAERKAGGARRNRPSPEPQRRHAGIDRKGPAGRRHRCHRHDSGGERHGQGSHGPLHSQPEPAQEPARSCRWSAAPCRGRSSRANCSVTSAERSPARTAPRRA